MEEVHFDRCQFDDVRLSIYKDKLHTIYGDEDARRMQVFTSKRNPHKRPSYLKNRKTLLAHIDKYLKYAPVNKRKKYRKRLLKIIYQYYALNYAARDISEILHTTPSSIKVTLYKLKYL